VRERELSESLAAVGVHEHHWLSYQDGTLADIDPARGSADIVNLLVAVQPEVIVTFGPEGMTGHPDHQAVSLWVTRACEELPAAPQIWHATQTPEFHRTWGRLNEAAGIWLDPAAAPSTPSDELVWSLPRHPALRNKKYAALQAHASQTRPLLSLVGESTYRAWWSGEYFVQAHAARRRLDAGYVNRGVTSV
jgi:LmbE family N-acetylglucosaminyl deacetylase